MLKTQKGFTLIELVIVIVILGILAAVAIPKYIDMKTEAQKAAAAGVFGAAQSAASVNFSANMLGKNLPLITNATTLVGAMTGVPDGWAAANQTLSMATYTITVGTGVSAETTTAPATLTKSW